MKLETLIPQSQLPSGLFWPSLTHVPGTDDHHHSIDILHVEI